MKHRLRNYNDRNCYADNSLKEYCLERAIDKEWYNDRWVDKYYFARDWFKKNWIDKYKINKI